MATRHAMPDTAAMAADDGAAHVEAVVARSGTSFYWSMRLLPPDQRAAMFAVYAFCREIDDIADGDDPTAQKLAALAEWRAEIERVFTGSPRSASHSFSSLPRLTRVRGRAKPTSSSRSSRRL